MLSFPKYASIYSWLSFKFTKHFHLLTERSEYLLRVYRCFFLLLLYLKSWKVFLGIVALAHINIHFAQVVKRARIFTDFLLILFWISTDINIHFAQVVKRGRIAASSGNNCGERNHCLRKQHLHRVDDNDWLTSSQSSEMREQSPIWNYQWLTHSMLSIVIS